MKKKKEKEIKPKLHLPVQSDTVDCDKTHLALQVDLIEFEKRLRDIGYFDRRS